MSADGLGAGIRVLPFHSRSPPNAAVPACSKNNACGLRRNAASDSDASWPLLPMCLPGTSGSPIRPSATPPSTAASTTPIASSSRENPCAARPPAAPHQLTPKREPRQHSPRPQTATTPRPASFGIGGRLQSEATASFVGIRTKATDRINFKGPSGRSLADWQHSKDRASDDFRARGNVAIELAPVRQG